MSFRQVSRLIVTFIACGILPGAGQTTEVPAKKPGPEEAVVDKAEPEAAPPLPKILGWKEWMWVIKPELILRAKLDTGARTCSIHATNIEAIEVDGEKWVKFTISDPGNEKGVRFRHKAPVVRVSKVKNDTGGLDERYVVTLPFQMGERKMEAEFNLNNRSQMNYAVLIGRNVLEKLGAVDAGRVNLLGKPKAPVRPKKKKRKSAKK